MQTDIYLGSDFVLNYPSVDDIVKRINCDLDLCYVKLISVGPFASFVRLKVRFLLYRSIYVIQVQAWLDFLQKK